MSHEELTWLDAHELAGSIRRREVSPVEAVEASLAQLERTEPQLNAFVTVIADQARAVARAAEKTLTSEPAESLPPLFGVPVSIKDLSDTAGVRTTYGAAAFADHVPAEDSVNARRIRESGAILVGKTATPEFGALGVTESGLNGITNNPWDTRFAAGGSSGGAAASVAAGVTAIAWGSDGGGSIRVPASMCGVVGLKASLGRIPFHSPWETSTAEGPIARSVADTALLLQVTAGPDRRDPVSLPREAVDYLQVVRDAPDLAGRRIAYAARPAGGPVAAEIESRVGAAVRRFEETGATVEAVDLPLPDPIAFFLDFWGIGFPELLPALGGAFPHPAMADLARRAGDAAAFYAAASQTRPVITETYARIFDEFDLLVTPTLPVAPFRHAGAHGGNADVDGVPVEVPSIDFHRFTESPSHAGLPAITVPAGFSTEGLPIGLQIVGDHLDDVGVLVAATNWERVAPWRGHRPELAIRR